MLILRCQLGRVGNVHLEYERTGAGGSVMSWIHYRIICTIPFVSCHVLHVTLGATFYGFVAQFSLRWPNRHRRYRGSFVVPAAWPLLAHRVGTGTRLDAGVSLVAERVSRSLRLKDDHDLQFAALPLLRSACSPLSLSSTTLHAVSTSGPQRIAPVFFASGTAESSTSLARPDSTFQRRTALAAEAGTARHGQQRRGLVGAPHKEETRPGLRPVQTEERCVPNVWAV